MPEMTPLATKIQFWDHLSKDTFAILLLKNGLGCAKILSESVFFADILLVGHGQFAIKFPFIAVKFY